MAMKWLIFFLFGCSLLQNGNASVTFAVGVATNIAASVMSYAIIKRMRRRDERFEKQRLKQKEADRAKAKNRNVRSATRASIPTQAPQIVAPWDWMMDSKPLNECFDIIEANSRISTHLVDCVGVQCKDPVVCVRMFPELKDCFNRTVKEMISRVGTSVDVTKFIHDFSGFTNCTTLKTVA